MNKNKIIIIIAITIMVITSIVGLIRNNRNDFDYSNIIINDNTEMEVIHEKNKIKIYVTGEVRNTGVIEIEEGERIADAIEKCGGLTEKADLKNVNLAYVLEDGQKLYIPNVDNIENIEYITKENGEFIIEATNNIGIKKINVNKATLSEFQTLPGVGPALAQSIMEYREKHGKFKTIEDMKNVNGIGDKKYEKLKDYIELK